MSGDYKRALTITLVAAATILGPGAVSQPLAAQVTPSILCRYDPRTGAPNPLGSRAVMTLAEADGNTEVTYTQREALVPGPADTVFTTQRSLIFPDASIDQVRQFLLNNDIYYQALVGLNIADGFGPVNDTLVCQAATVAAPAPSVPTMRPADRPIVSDRFQEVPRRPELPNLGRPLPRTSTSSAAAAPTTSYDTIASLADGNYRYVSGPADDRRAYTDQELLRRGGTLFVFRKTGERVIGSYGYIDDEAICVTGRVSGNTITGQAYPETGVARDLGETFEFWGPAAFLRVRRTQGETDQRYYSSATLELNDFSKINAGSSLPPSRCQL